MLKPEHIKIDTSHRIPKMGGAIIEVLAEAICRGTSCIDEDVAENRPGNMDDAIRRAKRGVYDAVYGEVAASIQRTIVEAELAKRSAGMASGLTSHGEYAAPSVRRIDTVIENLRKLLDKIDPPELRG